MVVESVPLVSVIVPTYNMGAYVADTVRSVQQQTITDLEIHVVDDGSTDDTKAKIEPLLADPRVHYYYQPNAGKSVAKNFGIRASRGAYVGFSDADDLWLPNKLELQLPAFEKSPEIGVVYSRSQRMDPDGNILEPYVIDQPSGWITQQLFQDNFVPFGTAVIRASAFEKFGGFNEKYRMGMDWELFLRLAPHYQFECIPAVTYLYRVWAGQMSSNWSLRYTNALRIMEEFVAANPGAVSPELARKAVAGTILSRARARANLAGDYRGAVQDAVSAVARGASVPAATRLIVRCLLRILHLAHGPLDK